MPYHGRLQAAAVALTRFDAHFDPMGQHVRFFTRTSLAATLDAAGFEPRVWPVLRRRSLAALAAPRLAREATTMSVVLCLERGSRK